MSWISLIMLILEIIKWITSLRKPAAEKAALTTEMHSEVLKATQTKDLRPLRALLERIKACHAEPAGG